MAPVLYPVSVLVLNVALLKSLDVSLKLLECSRVFIHIVIYKQHILSMVVFGYPFFLIGGHSNLEVHHLWTIVDCHPLPLVSKLRANWLSPFCENPGLVNA